MNEIKVSVGSKQGMIPNGTIELRSNGEHEVAPYKYARVVDIRERYTGAYTVSQEFEDVILPTSEKTLTNDVTVKAIEVKRVLNSAGGNTVYIGGEA